MDRFDVLVLLGVLTIGTGLGMRWPWVGVTTAGVIVLGVGLVGAALSVKAAATRDLVKAKGGER